MWRARARAPGTQRPASGAVACHPAVPHPATPAAQAPRRPVHGTGSKVLTCLRHTPCMLSVPWPLHVRPSRAATSKAGRSSSPHVGPLRRAALRQRPVCTRWRHAPHPRLAVCEPNCLIDESHCCRHRMRLEASVTWSACAAAAVSAPGRPPVPGWHARSRRPRRSRRPAAPCCWRRCAARAPPRSHSCGGVHALDTPCHALARCPRPAARPRRAMRRPARPRLRTLAGPARPELVLGRSGGVHARCILQTHYFVSLNTDRTGLRGAGTRVCMAQADATAAVTTN